MSELRKNEVKRKFDVVAARRYESRGKSNTHWVHCGDAIEFGNGDINIRLDAIPTFSGWDSKLSLFIKRTDTDNVVKEDKPF